MQFVLCDLRIPHRKAELRQENEVAEVKFESISGILNSPMGVIRCARIIACRNVFKDIGDRGFPSSLDLRSLKWQTALSLTLVASLKLNWC